MGRAGAPIPGSVLFVCTMNAVRSPMASAIFQHLVGEASVATSAGVRPALSDPFVVAVMDEIGIDLSEFQPQGLEAVKEQHFDEIISLSPEAHHHAVELTRVMAAEVFYWPTIDIAVIDRSSSRLEKLAAYRSVRDSLFKRIKREFALSGGPTV